MTSDPEERMMISVIEILSFIETQDYYIYS
jgi:hypothetical protein